MLTCKYIRRGGGSQTMLTCKYIRRGGGSQTMLTCKYIRRWRKSDQTYMQVHKKGRMK